MSVHEDRVVRPDGTAGIFGVMTVRNASVLVVALTEDEDIWMVEVDRHTVGPSLEVPSGGSDGQEPLVAAQRELDRRSDRLPFHSTSTLRWPRRLARAGSRRCQQAGDGRHRRDIAIAACTAVRLAG